MADDQHDAEPKAPGAPGKTAVIEAALRRLQADYEAAREDAPEVGVIHDDAGTDEPMILASLTLVSAPPPDGVSQSEWDAAIENDLPLQRLFGNEQEPMPKTQLTQPKGIDAKTGKPYESIEIPVPKRSAFDRLLHRAENTPPPKRDR
jgi:hypothetical protein